MKILDLLTSQPDNFKYLLDLDPSAQIFKALENLRQTVDDKNILFILKDICSKEMPIEKAENLIGALFSASQTLNNSPEDSWMLQTIVNTITNEQLAGIGIVKEKNQPFDIIAYLMSLFLSYPIFLNENNYPCLYPINHFTHFTPALPEEGQTISEMLLFLSTKQKEKLLEKLKNIDPLKITYILINQETGLKTEIPTFNPDILKHDVSGKIISTESFAGKLENRLQLWKDLLTLIETTVEEKGLQTTLSLAPITRYPGAYSDSYFATSKTLEKYEKEHGNLTTKDWELFKSDFENIDFTVEEQRVMHAIFTLHTTCSLENNIWCRWSDIYRACDLKPVKTKNALRFSGNAVKEIHQTIDKLQNKQINIVYRTNTVKGKEKKYDCYVTKEPIFKIVKAYKDLTESESKTLLGNPIKDEKRSGIYIQISPALLKHKDYYFTGDRAFFEKLKEIKKSKKERLSKYDGNFFLWLLKQKQQNPIYINRFQFATNILKMGSTIVKRTPSTMHNTIENLYKTFLQLEYIEKYEINIPKTDGGTKDILHLNFDNLHQKKTTVIFAK